MYECKYKIRNADFQSVLRWTEVAVGRLGKSDREANGVEGECVYTLAI